MKTCLPAARLERGRTCRLGETRHFAPVVQKPFVGPGRREYFVDSLGRGPRGKRSPAALEDLLWRARRWLEEVRSAPAELGPAIPRRLESAADEAFRAGELDFAEESYRILGDDPQRSVRMMLKLADIRFLRGDVEGERELREAIYGRLDVE